MVDQGQRTWSTMVAVTHKFEYKRTLCVTLDSRKKFFLVSFKLKI